MKVGEFIKECPNASRLFDTPGSQSKYIISIMMTRYSLVGRKGTGHVAEYSGKTWRALVAHRLCSLALKDMTGANASISNREALSTLVKESMPSSLTLNTNSCRLQVFVPKEIQMEVNRLK